MERAIEVSINLRDNMYDRKAWRDCIDNNGMAPVYPPSKQTVDALEKLMSLEDGHENINWGMFDKIYCFHYVHDKKRYDTLKEELIRVGIWGCDNFELVETVRTTYEEKHLSGYSNGELNLAINTLRCLERAKAHGYKRILFLEDDIRFLKNKMWIKTILENSPDTDVVLYDIMNFIFPPEYCEVCESRKINEFFAGWDSGLYACSCYSVSCRCIDKLITMYNEKLRPVDHYLQGSWFSKSFSFVNLCCQQADEESMLYERVKTKCYNQKNGYAFKGLDFSMYNCIGDYSYCTDRDIGLSFPVVVVGRNRTIMTCEVIERIKKHAGKENLFFIIVSDRSDSGHREYLTDWCKSNGVKYKIIETKDKTKGVGGCLKLGSDYAFTINDTCLFVENDWLLECDIDVSKYENLLRKSLVGCLSFKQIDNVDTEEYVFESDVYLLRKKKDGNQAHSNEITFGCFMAHKRFIDSVKFSNSENTEEAETCFINSYMGISRQNRINKRILCAHDKNFYHTKLNDRNCVFSHVGMVGEHMWKIPVKYEYLNDLRNDRRARNSVQEDEQVHWGLYFDRIYCIRHLEEGKENTRIIDELDRVGILDSGIFEWRNTTFSPCDKLIADDIGNINTGYVNLMLEQIKILSEAKHFNYQSILILEEDVAFRKDLSGVGEILNCVPLDADVVQLDKQIHDCTETKWKEALCGCCEEYVERGNMWATSTACLWIRNNGIEKLLNAFITGKNGKIHASDNILHLANVKKYLVVNNIAVQTIIPNTLSVKRDEVLKYINSYEHNGIAMDKYNIPDNILAEYKLLQNKVLIASNGMVKNERGETINNGVNEVFGDNIFVVPNSKYGKEAFLEIFKKAIDGNYEYILYADADCYIVSRKNLISSFASFIKSKKTFSGMSDGGVICHRTCNPWCINPFLLYVKVDCLRKYYNGSCWKFNDISEFNGWDDGGYSEHTWSRARCASDLYRMKHSKRTISYLAEAKKNGCSTWGFDEKNTSFETYYSIFLGIDAKNNGVRYLAARDYEFSEDTSGCATAVFDYSDDEEIDLSNDDRIICIHSWYARCAMRGDLYHIKRIERIANFAKSKREKGVW